MRVFPESAPVQLEFDKIKTILAERSKSEYAKAKANDLRIHTVKDLIDTALKQTHEYKQLLVNGMYFPNEVVLNLSREIKLLGIPGAVLSSEQFVSIRRLAQSMQSIFRWFDAERKEAYPALAGVVSGTHYEKKILEMLGEVLDENGAVLDNASEELRNIRLDLYRKRNELRRAFDRIVQKLNKEGYLADIEESFLNGRRVLAVFAEQKRVVKGILHGESDTRRTAFIEPEETIGLNNDVFSLEHEESREVYRILRELTAQLSVYAPLLSTYYEAVGEYDFIEARARLAAEMNGEYPLINDRSHVHLVNACHPLLYLYNKRQNKPVIPVSVTLDDKSRILVISGPNAGGKTVTMKTVGLLQMMVQSGLLVPVHPASQMGVFKQLMIHIGDTQSLEFELSTYSAHLKNMKHFIEHANGRTLFFIDELGSGSDPDLGGAFAEVIMEELARKHAYGIVTTHYLNLKVMANKVPGIMNGAMAFDEKTLMPLYRLITGKPGSSYTFSIAERIGLDKRLIERARELVDEDHFRLDKLLNRTEQELQVVQKEKGELNRLLKENQQLKTEMEAVLIKEKHLQQVELLKQQNKITEDRLVYLKDMERKLKQIVLEWKKAEDKNKVVKEIQHLLFNKKDKQVVNKLQKKVESRYNEVGGEVNVGDKVKMKKNHQVGEVLEIRGKRAVVKIGLLPMQVDLENLVVVKEKITEE
ncbi:MAG: DNA mismatch repair protein MutS [Williamsia sp.]|nr:DNA mismatch repair protein MutS [Williamsia sp.]